MKKNPLYPSRLRNRVEFLRRVVTVEHGISKERWETAFAVIAAGTTARRSGIPPIHTEKSSGVAIENTEKANAVIHQP